MNAGVKEGKNIGLILNKLLDKVLDELEFNTKDTLMQYVAELKNEIA